MNDSFKISSPLLRFSYLVGLLVMPVVLPHFPGGKNFSAGLPAPSLMAMPSTARGQSGMWKCLKSALAEACISSLFGQTMMFGVKCCVIAFTTRQTAPDTDV